MNAAISFVIWITGSLAYLYFLIPKMSNSLFWGSLGLWMVFSGVLGLVSKQFLLIRLGGKKYIESNNLHQRANQWLIAGGCIVASIWIALYLARR